MSFQNLGLSDEVVHGVQSMGLHGSDAESSCRLSPSSSAGKDIIGASQTGTGKTAAFMLPLLTLLKEHSHARPARSDPRADARTRRAGRCRLARLFPLRQPAHHGRLRRRRLRRARKRSCKRGTDVLVATPGRLLDFMEKGTIKLDTIEHLVLDEADRMLDMGFMPDVRRIIDKCPKERQTLLFSATMPPEIAKLTEWALRNPEKIEIGGRRSPAETVTHALYPVAASQKFDLLLEILERTHYHSVLIFCRTKMNADRIAARLESAGHTVAVDALGPLAGRAHRGAGGFPQRQVRGHGRDRHRLARHRHFHHHPRHQLRRAAASRRLRAPHRPHRPRRRPRATPSR